jgi:hypothetical protein
VALPRSNSVAVGDPLWDAMQREWAVVDADSKGLTLEDAEGEAHRFTWHGLMTLGVRRIPPQTRI